MMMPVGRLTLICTDSGPSSDRANLMPKPAMPAISKAPSTPAKKIRFLTGVEMSASSMTWSELLILMMPPMSAALSLPPNSSPSTSTPNDAMPTTGNSP